MSHCVGIYKRLNVTFCLLVELTRDFQIPNTVAHTSYIFPLDPWPISQNMDPIIWKSAWPSLPLRCLCFREKIRAGPWQEVISPQLDFVSSSWFHRKNRMAGGWQDGQELPGGSCAFSQTSPERWVSVEGFYTWRSPLSPGLSLFTPRVMPHWKGQAQSALLDSLLPVSPLAECLTVAKIWISTN